MSRKVITVLVAVAVMFLVGTHLVNDTNAGETVAPVAVAGCAGSVQSGCSGSVPVVTVFRRAPIRTWFANRRIQRAARRSCGGCGGYSAPSGCSAPQAVPVQACVPVQMVQPVQVISVAPIRLFRSCANGQCR